MDEAFNRALVRLRAVDPMRVDPRLRELSRIIVQQADRPWRLRMTADGTDFHISRTQQEVRFHAEGFGRICGRILDGLAACPDVRVAAAWSALGRDARAWALELYLATFLAHEFLHLEQNLGSDQYKDSDFYLEAVAAVDYQADLGALQHVLAAYEPNLGLPRNDLFAVLIAAHLFSMHAFTPHDPERSYPGDAFERILVWTFQFARVAAAEHPADPGHPGLEMMPVINLPRAGRPFGASVEPGFRTGQSNSAAEARQDIVVASPDARGLQTIKRMVSTDAGCVDQLIQAVLAGDLVVAREVLGEFFAAHPSMVDLRRRAPRGRILNALSSAKSAGDALAGRADVLSAQMPDVIDFFERIDLILQMRPAPRGEWVGLARAAYGEDALAAVVAAGPPAEAGERMSVEIKRLRIRLSMSLDLEDES